jgi:hypothetical protein
LKIDPHLSAAQLSPQVDRLFDLSGEKILSLEKSWNPDAGAPVFTRRGRYTTRGWTEWTQGFQYGSALLQFDATGDSRFWELGWEGTRARMARHVSHTGVHDHGFNNISTYGHALRLMREGRVAANPEAADFCELALKISGAVQAARWTRISDGRGFIYSFNGPHSLFIDTIRTLRSLGAAHLLGHALTGEGDRKISLLDRLVQHALVTAEYAVYYGKGRDGYDRRGRVAHESVFNVNDGQYRCPNSQQGYSPFTTWTRGLAWAICGFAEQLEFLQVAGGAALEPLGGIAEIETRLLSAARATADFYLENSCADGIPMWDEGAPHLPRLGDYLERPADPFNEWEPVDSSAAAIAAQGLIRLGNYLGRSRRDGKRFRQAGLTIARTLFSEPYLSTGPRHQGLILHSVYHRPNGWDYIPPSRKIPLGESSMWGDYHARELAVMIQREAAGAVYPAFFKVIS